MNNINSTRNVRFGSRIARRAILLLSAAGLLCLAAPMSRADGDEDKDPPSRVARVSYLDGTVSLQPGGEGEWGSAAMNRPMTIGDKIWVDKDSRVELQAGQASIHLGSMTALSFLNLDANITQMRLAEGSLNFRVRELREGDLYELDAPNLAFTVKQAGAFRIDVDENGEASRVTVIRGEGEVVAGGKTYTVHSGERAEFSGADNVESNITRAPGPDGLDRWSSQRDVKEDNSVSAKYVSRDMVGYSDLDDHGTWNEEPEYGHVWYPNGNEIDEDWAPYSNGSWNYVAPWGWTWVDYSPWGFAPFHYGRWAFIGSRWGWAPGPYYGAPIYGPAFVGFYGGGFGLGVGWFPLGFGEPFFPWFRCGFGFRERINVRNTFIRNVNVIHGNVRNVNFVNAHNVRAVTVTNRNTFANGQRVNRGAFHVTSANLRGAQVTNSVGVHATEHSSLGASNLNSRAARPSNAVQNRSVVARTSPARGASGTRVHTVDSSHLTPGRATGNGAVNRSADNGGLHERGAVSGRSDVSPRQRQLSQNRPPSAVGNSQRTGSNSRNWEAQGNSTDRGRAPAGSGQANRSMDSQSQRSTRTDRPSLVGRPDYGTNSTRGASPNGNVNRPNYSNSGRSYSPPPARSSSAPRTYSAPSRSYPAPSRSNSAPSRSSGGSGGSRGGSPHSGGSTSHGRH